MCSLCANCGLCYAKLCTVCTCMQGYGVRVDPMQVGTPALEAAILEVLADPKYSQAARAVSARIRARKDTPLQEAGGEHRVNRLKDSVPAHGLWACMLLENIAHASA